MTFWNQLGRVVEFSGVFFAMACGLSLVTSVWVYLDSNRYWHDESRALLLATVTGIFQLCLYFIHPLYLFTFASGLAIMVLLGYRLPFATQKCGACGSANPVVAQSCSSCGNPIRYAANDPKICPECERVHSGDGRYCLHCGMALIKYEPKLPGPRRDGGVVNCPGCEAKNMNWRNECWKCKHILSTGNKE